MTFPKVRTRSITLTFLEDTSLTSVGSLTGAARSVSVAVAEVRLVGGPEVRYDRYGVVRLGCGSGPVVSVGGTRFRTAVTASARDVVAGAVVRADLCGKAELTAGEVEVGVPASFSWTPLGLVLSGQPGVLRGVGRDDGESPSERPVAVPAPVLDRLGTQHSVAVPLDEADAEQTLTLAVPAATGWEAHTSDGRLQPITVDGWAQAWAVPAGVERVELRYSAGGSLRTWVGSGAVGWALVVLLAVSGAVFRGRAPGSRWDHRMAGRSTHA